MTITNAAGTQDLLDVVVDTMPQTLSPFRSRLARLRPAGVPPVARVVAAAPVDAAALRLPTAPALADWVQRAAGVLGLKQDGPAFAGQRVLR